MLKIGLHLKAGSTTDPLVDYLLRPLTLMKMESCAAERDRLQRPSVHIPSLKCCMSCSKVFPFNFLH